MYTEGSPVVPFASCIVFIRVYLFTLFAVRSVTREASPPYRYA
jgi:hypothetical protein